MAAAKRKAAAPRARRTAAATKRPVTRRRKKKPDRLDDALAAGAGYVAPDVLPALPWVGPWLAAHPSLPPALVAALLTYVGGRIVGGPWRRAGKYAAAGAAAHYILRRAGTGEVGEAGEQQLIDARALFEEIDRQLPPPASPAQSQPQPQAVVRRIGDIVR